MPELEVGTALGLSVGVVAGVGEEAATAAAGPPAVLVGRAGLEFAREVRAIRWEPASPPIPTAATVAVTTTTVRNGC